MEGQSYLESEKAFGMGSGRYGNSRMMGMMKGMMPQSVSWVQKIVGHFMIVCLFALIFWLIIGPDAISGTIAYKKLMAKRKVSDEMMRLTNRDDKIYYLRGYGIHVEDNESDVRVETLLNDSKDEIAKKINPEAAVQQTWFQAYFEMFYFSIMTHVGLGFGDMFPVTFMGQAFVICHLFAAWGFLMYVI
jgi:hypothetical protein